MKLHRWLCALLLQSAIWTAPAAQPARMVTDLAGRDVAVPLQVQRIATIGAVPVLNSFVFALGDGGKLVNGLPPGFSRSGRYRFQSRFAPAIPRLPVVQGQGLAPDLEALAVAGPDVVLTMDRAVPPSLERFRVPVICLAWRNAEDVPQLMRLLGEVLGRPKEAEDYIRYFDGVKRRVADRLRGASRPRVLYCSVRRLTQDHLIADWWIQAAGGLSVTADGRRVEGASFSQEQILAWNPDVIIVPSPEDKDELLRDARFSSLRAVRDHRVSVSPMGAHLWANRTSELPLMILWAARVIHPERSGGLDLEREMGDFYARFYRVRLDRGEIAAILQDRP